MVDEELLKNLHHVLLEVRRTSCCERVSYPPQIHIDEGAMLCPNCGHSYPISNGIPNMVRTPLPLFVLS